MKIRFLCAAALLVVFALGGLETPDKSMAQKDIESIKAIAATRNIQDHDDQSGH